MALIDINCCKCRLISEECFFEITGLNKNILAENLIKAWNIAHDLELKNLIGVECAEDLCNAGYYTPAQEELIIQIQNWLAYTILYYYTVESWSGQYKNYGITDTNTDSEKSVDSEKYNAKVNQILSVIEGYKQLFLTWANDNLDEYPCLPFKKKCLPENNLNVDILPV